MDRNFFVDEINGSDTNDGTAERPFKSLQSVIDQRIPAVAWFPDGSKIVIFAPGEIGSQELKPLEFRGYDSTPGDT